MTIRENEEEETQETADWTEMKRRKEKKGQGCRAEQQISCLTAETENLTMKPYNNEF